jgi:hypothetical protein
MAARRFAWVLNLDADLELAARGAYTPKRSVREAMRPWTELLATSLLGEGDVLVDDEAEPLIARGLIGRAFCPTPRAIATLLRAGAEPEPYPAVDVLRLVNSRAFASSLGATLPGAAFVPELAAARAMVAEPPPVGEGWRLKRNFGMTGRGQRAVAPGLLADADASFVRAGLEEGGVQIEPNVTILAEYALHGLLADSGSFELGAPVRQRCDARGAWVATEPLDAPRADEHELLTRLSSEVSLVAAALTKARYFGPFGIDAYTYRGRDGAPELQVRSEINARYSMGFAVGFRRQGPQEVAVDLAKGGA